MKTDKFTINKKGCLFTALPREHNAKDMGLQAKSLAALKGSTEDKIIL